MTEIKKRESIPTMYLQLIAMLFLIALVIVDKIMKVIVPPVEELWYYALFIALFVPQGIERLITYKLKK